MKRAAYLTLAAVVVLADALTKWAIARWVPLHDGLPVIPHLFDIVHVRNTGAAFGIGANAGSPAVPMLLNGGAIAVFFIIGVYALRAALSNAMLQSALHLILGGAVGNLIDRFRFGYVVDFLDVHLGDHHWPAFNVADSAICVGIVLLFLDMRRKPAETPTTVSS